MNFPDTMEAYALDPTPEHLENLHRAIMSSPGYDPLVSIGPTIGPLVQAGDHQGVVDALWAQMPGIFLSPAAHMHLSQAYEQLGEERAAGRERRFALLAMASIREGADGSEGAPYPVLRIEDEYTVLDAAGQRSCAQEQVTREDGAFDIHTLEDGSQVWFRLLWLPARLTSA